eukprot:Polyplicarium_translucidae@DN3346_c0_g3_i4.p3
MSCLLRTKSFSKDVPKMTVDDKLVRLLRRYSEGEVDVDKVVRRAKCLLSNDGGECHSQLKCRRQLKGGSDVRCYKVEKSTLILHAVSFKENDEEGIRTLAYLHRSAPEADVLEPSCC